MSSLCRSSCVLSVLLLLVLTQLVVVEGYLVVDVDGMDNPLESGGGWGIGIPFGLPGLKKKERGKKKKRSSRHSVGETCFHHDWSTPQTTVGHGSPVNSAKILINYHLHKSGETDPQLDLILKVKLPGEERYVQAGDHNRLNFGSHEALELEVDHIGPFRICLFNHGFETRRISLHVEDSFQHDARIQGQNAMHAVDVAASAGGASAIGPHGDDFIQPVHEYQSRTQLFARVETVVTFIKDLTTDKKAFNATVQSTHNRVLFFTVANVAVLAASMIIQTLQVKAVLREKKVV